MSSVEDDQLQHRTREAERTWHDKLYKANAATAYPESAEDFRELYRKQHLTPFCDGGWSWWADARREMLDMLGEVRGKRVLDYGCGFGMLGMYLGLCGAEVWGFDLSLSAVETANRTALRYGLPARFEQMDAAALTYPDGFFDLAVGFGVLHHVIKYPRTGSQLARVVKPGGAGVFHETLWDNPFINFARRFTGVDSDAGDALLTERAIRSFGNDFREIRLERRNLLYMLKRLAPLPVHDPLAPPKRRPLWQAIKAVDQKLLGLAALNRYCGEVIVFLQK
jgi:2-polyprenyl-3-methyl-5-hydroxy-6-metoxy-1,4-benzoquinol methylase